MSGCHPKVAKTAASSFWWNRTKGHDNRFGGCMVASSSSAPPLWGLWHPPQESQAEKDYLTTAEVLANPIEAANRFFVGSKPILKTAGHIEHQEILISRLECRLM
jgi:hypothetical protein